MQSIVSSAAVRACASIIAAAFSPSRRVVWEEMGQDWMPFRKLSDVALAYPDGSGLELACGGRLWVLTTEARPFPVADLED
jgi:hypothetical protein